MKPSCEQSTHPIHQCFLKQYMSLSIRLALTRLKHMKHVLRYLLSSNLHILKNNTIKSQWKGWQDSLCLQQSRCHAQLQWEDSPVPCCHCSNWRPLPLALAIPAGICSFKPSTNKSLQNAAIRKVPPSNDSSVGEE